jgi:hypothetical protein
VHADGTVAGCTLDDDTDGCDGRDARYEGRPRRCFEWWGAATTAALSVARLSPGYQADNAEETRSPPERLDGHMRWTARALDDEQRS